MGKLKVYSECCKNCLFTPDRIVSTSRFKELIQSIVKEQSYFICHKSSMNDGKIVCHSFYNALGYKCNLIRIMQRIDGIEFVQQTDQEKLTPYTEMKPRKFKKATT